MERKIVWLIMWNRCAYSWVPWYILGSPDVQALGLTWKNCVRLCMWGDCLILLLRKERKLVLHLSDMRRIPKHGKEFYIGEVEPGKVLTNVSWNLWWGCTLVLISVIVKIFIISKSPQEDLNLVSIARCPTVIIC